MKNENTQQAIHTPEYVPTMEDKAYWVGQDENGIIKYTLDIHDIKMLSNLRDVVAVNSEQAMARYLGILSEGK